MAIGDPPGPETPQIMQLVYWGGLGLGTLILGLLGYRHKPKPPETTASIAGALIDNRAVDPLLTELRGLREDLQNLRSVLGEEATARKRDMDRAAVKAEFEAGQRMADILEALQRAKEGKL